MIQEPLIYPFLFWFGSRIVFADLRDSRCRQNHSRVSLSPKYEHSANGPHFRSTAIDYLEREHRRAQVGVAYVYCLYNDAHQTAASLLGSLLQQLARQNDAIRDDIKSCHKHHTDWGTRPTLYEISRLLCLQVQNFDEVFIIIDALDECPEAGQVRRDFLMEVRRLLPDIRLMVTSRHLASIESTFKQDTRLEIRAHDQDVRKFIEAQVERTELVHVLEGHDNMRSLIGDMVLKKTNGMSVNH